MGFFANAHANKLDDSMTYNQVMLYDDTSFRALKSDSCLHNIGPN